MAGERKQVRAISTGFIGGSRRKPGEVFEVAVDDNAKWFEDAAAPRTEGTLQVGAVKGTLAAKRADEGKVADSKATPKYRAAQNKKAARTAKIAATRDPESVDDLV